MTLFKHNSVFVNYFNTKWVIVVFFIVLVILIVFYNSSNISNSKYQIISESKEQTFAQEIKTLPAQHIDKTLRTKLKENFQENAPTAQEIQEFIKKHNQEQKILNLDQYGALEQNASVIVVQVHDRLNYLRIVIDSLAKAKGIERALVIFTHDIYDEAINQIVQNIKFCKVLQIFYPYSVQTHPNEFPGLDPNDCVGSVNIAKSNNVRCGNLEQHDHYGNFRDGGLTQIKHHWLWKVNQVFEHLSSTSNHSGLVLFSEDDHYLVEDFLYVLNLLEAKSLEHFNYNLVSLGKYATNFNNYIYRNEISVTSLFSNLGLSFNRDTWNLLKKCKKEFCYYDDYNWDLTLQHILDQCLNSELLSMIVTQGPRAIHIGKCGTHIHSSLCEVEELMKGINTMLKVNKDKGNLFPSDFKVNEVRNLKKPKEFLGFGGWGDQRDRDLCMSIVKN